MRLGVGIAVAGVMAGLGCSRSLLVDEGVATSDTDVPHSSGANDGLPSGGTEAVATGGTGVVGGNGSSGNSDDDPAIWGVDAGNPDGRAPRLVRLKSDSTCDCTLDHCETYTYDADGNLTGKSGDDCHGTEDWCFQYDHDLDGNLTREATCNGFRCKTYSYDAEGNPTSEFQDDDCDGVPNQCTHYTYDAKGNRTGETFEHDCDGTPTGCVSYTNDAEGHRTSEIADDF